jgi:putative PIN family toxin of toxin-antitoxin system
VRAVLDPNVVISGLISRKGPPARLLASWREGHFEAVVSPLLLEELRRALAYPKLRRRLPADDAEAAVRWLAAGATPADDPGAGPPVRSSDPGDDYLIALAAEQTAALVSGDRHLLDLKDRIPVYSPSDFLALVERTT